MQRNKLIFKTMFTTSYIINVHLLCFLVAIAGTNILLPASLPPNLPIVFPAEHGFLNHQMKKQKDNCLSQTTLHESLFKV